MQDLPSLKSKTYAQAWTLQDLTYKLAIDMGSEGGAELEPRERAKLYADLVRSWDTCCERVRIIRGKPLPGSLRPVKTHKPRRRPGSSVAPVEGGDHVQAAGESRAEPGLEPERGEISPAE